MRSMSAFRVYSSSISAMISMSSGLNDFNLEAFNFNTFLRFNVEEDLARCLPPFLEWPRCKRFVLNRSASASSSLWLKG